ncbi:PAN domain-containing protein [Burkholderia sp. LMU1-1-1.1]|uniref:PAN domain-containing protein n=1 Tax=Burkholderia sp. LMU1-1-1.1 TaxID=3135266 RepID=UPI0034243AF3
MGTIVQSMSRFASAAFAFGILATSLGVAPLAYADDPLKPISNIVERDRANGPCRDAVTFGGFGPFFSYNKKLEEVAQAYARAEKNIPGNNLSNYGTIVSFLGTGDPQSQAIDLAYKRGAGNAVRNCAFKEYGVGFWRDEGREIDFVTIVFGVPTPPDRGTIVRRADRPGSDYRNFDISPPSGVISEIRPDLCEAACSGEAMCKAWTYVEPGVQGRLGKCWLKNAVPAAVACSNCSSGVKTPANETNIDRPGGDFTHFTVGAGQLSVCETACTKDSRCATWTYVRPGVQGPAAQCWLKDRTPPPVASDCCTTGTVQRPTRLPK